MVEGTPLLREHAVMSCIEGSNPSASAKPIEAPEERSSGAFLMEGAKPPGQGVFQLSAFTKVIVYVAIGFFVLVALLGLASRTPALVVPGLGLAAGIALLAWSGMKLQRRMNRPRADGSQRPALGKFGIAVAYLLLAACVFIGLLGIASGHWILLRLALVLGSVVSLITWVVARAMAALDGAPSGEGGEVGRLRALSERHAALNNGMSARAKRTIAIIAIVAAVVNLVGVVIRLLPTLLR